MFRKNYQVDVYYVDERGWRHHLNSILVKCRSKKAAVGIAYDEVWDTRLETAGCSPAYVVHRV